jgi:NitT/TauT family transport system permease protein
MPSTERAAGTNTRRFARLAPLLSVGLALVIWDLVSRSGAWPPWLLPGPVPVLGRLLREFGEGSVFEACRITLGRAALGLGISVLIGGAAGLALGRFSWLRAAFAPLLAGLQTVPSVTWFPLAILLFQLSEEAILTVVVLGATPCIAIALLDSFDRVPPVLVKAGRSMGLEGFGLFWHVLLPGAMPGFVSGVKQGWAFAWRSLMAGELLVLIGDRPSLGAHLHFARELSDAEGLLAWLVVVLSIGIAIDMFFFRTLEDALHRRHGLTRDATR